VPPLSAPINFITLSKRKCRLETKNACLAHVRPWVPSPVPQKKKRIENVSQKFKASLGGDRRVRQREEGRGRGKRRK
jgi:hypothetical protein